jgi:hypothetical protein
VTKYRLELVWDNEAWDSLVKMSPQGTIFAQSSYLTLAVDNYRRYWVLKGNQIKGGLSIVLNTAEDRCVLDDLVIHNGIMFVDSCTQKATRKYSERFQITEFVIDWLVGKFRNVELSLSPQFQDPRPFLWHNYHSKETKEKFVLDLKFTSYLEISSLCGPEKEESTALFKELESLRQRNIREARRDGATYEIDSHPEIFIEYYAELMRNQSQKQETEKLRRMERLIRGLIRLEQAVIVMSRNGEGRPVYSTIFCWDSKRAYYLFGAPNPTATNRYKGTIAIWDGFHELVRRGISTIDMEGVNSPERGRFKLSFGGRLVPYYEVRWKA